MYKVGHRVHVIKGDHKGKIGIIDMIMDRGYSIKYMVYVKTSDFHGIITVNEDELESAS